MPNLTTVLAYEAGYRDGLKRAAEIADEYEKQQTWGSDMEYAAIRIAEAIRAEIETQAKQDSQK